MIYNTALIVFLLDRLAKILIIINISVYESRELFSFIYLRHIYNTGAAFSIFAGRNRLLIIINLAVISALTAFIKFSSEKGKVNYLAYAFIIGGALSNLADRILYGGVIDYIDFRVWPVFNLADAAISCGALLLAYDIIKSSSKKKDLKNAA